MENATITSLSDVKNNNKRAIIEYLHSVGSTSRSALAQALHLSKPSVSCHLTPLLALGLIQEIGRGESTCAGGRKPIILSFNARFRYILAIDLLRNAPFFVLGDLYGNTVSEFHIRLPELCDPATCVRMILSSVQMFLAANNVSENKLCYIAISCPGIFSPDGESCFIGDRLLSQYAQTLLQELRSQYTLPIIIKNDVKVATIGEQRFGAAIHSKDFLYLHCGYGLGAGIVLNHELLEGLNYSAGEIFNFIDPASYHSRTNLESCVNIDALLTNVTQEIQSGASSILDGIIQSGHVLSFDDITTAYRARDEVVCAQLRSIAEKLGCHLANIVNLLSIDTIVLGGEYTAFAELFLDVFAEITSSYCHPKPTILSSKLSNIHAEVCGLFYLASTQYFDDLCVSDAPSSPSP